MSRFLKTRLDDATDHQLSLGSVLVQQHAPVVDIRPLRHGGVSPSFREHLHQLLLGYRRPFRRLVVRLGQLQTLRVGELDRRLHELNLSLICSSSPISFIIPPR